MSMSINLRRSIQNGIHGHRDRLVVDLDGHPLACRPILEDRSRMVPMGIEINWLSILVGITGDVDRFGKIDLKMVSLGIEID